MKTKIIFKIDNALSLIIKNLCYEGNHLYRWDPIEIIFKDENSEYIINQHDHLMPQVEQLYDCLQGAISNKLSLLKSIKADLGYLWNQDLNHCSITSHEQLQKEKDWKGAKYLMWDGNKFDTWLYNKNNKIYIEITPIYPWHFNKPKAEDNYIPYDEWIKNYKPLVIIEIDKVAAKQWYDQAGKIMQEIEKNDEKYLHTPQE